MQDAVESEELEAVAADPIVSASSPAEENNGNKEELDSEGEGEKTEDESPRGRRKMKSRRVSSTSSGSQNRLLPLGMTEALTVSPSASFSSLFIFLSSGADGLSPFPFCSCRNGTRPARWPSGTRVANKRSRGASSSSARISRSILVFPSFLPLERLS